MHPVSLCKWEIFLFINMQMSVLPCQIAGFKIYSRAEAIWSFNLSSSFYYFKNLLVQHNIFLHGKRRAWFPLDTITGMWLGSCGACRVIQGIGRGCSIPGSTFYLGDSSRGAGAQLTPQPHGQAGPFLFPLWTSPPRSCWSFPPWAAALSLVGINPARDSPRPLPASGTSLTSPCSAPRRFQGSGIFQRHLWLPVPHVPVHGGPAGSAPRGGFEGLAGDDGGGREGGAALPGPGFYSRGSHRVAPESNGTVSPCFYLYQARFGCWLGWLCFTQLFVKCRVGVGEEIWFWRCCCGVLEKLLLSSLVQWVGLCCLWCITVPQSREQTILRNCSFVSGGWGKTFFFKNQMLRWGGKNVILNAFR